MNGLNVVDIGDFVFLRHESAANFAINFHANHQKHNMNNEKNWKLVFELEKKLGHFWGDNFRDFSRQLLPV